MSIITTVSDVKTNRRARYAALTCEAVLESAKTLFISKGFDATSVDDIALLAQASKGAVYHHFRDKQTIFAELFSSSQEAVIVKVIGAMPANSEEPWAKVTTAIQLFLHGYVTDDDARALLRQVVSVLGWERVRALNERQTLPFMRATLASFVANGYARPVPIDATVELFFGMFYNGVLFITDAQDPETASNEVETVILSALEGLKPPR